MMLQALIAYAEREGLGDADFEDRKVHWLLPVTAGGKFAGQPIPMIEDPTAKKPLPRRLRVPFTEQSQLTIASQPRSHFLCDSLERAAAMPNPKAEDGNTRRAAQHEYFKSLLREAASASPAEAKRLEALLQMLEDPTETVRLHAALTEAKAKPTDNATFQVDGATLLDSQEIQAFWRNRRQSARPTGDQPKRICLATGRLAPTLDTTEKIKGVPGGLAVGTSLISFDKDAFTSFGLEQAQNAAISADAELKFRSALNTLIADGLRIQDTVHLHWTRKPVANDPFEMVASANPEAVRNLMDSPRTGTTTAKLDATEYYLLSLSGNGGRIVVRDWLESTLGQVQENIRAWFADLTIISPEADGPKSDFKFGALLYGMVRDKLEELPPQIPTQLLHAAIKGSVLPTTALAAVLRRQQIDSNKLNPARIALIKAVLNRQDRFNQRNEQHTMNEQLNPESRDAAYLCGRLFAVFDRLQHLALGGVNAGVVERYYASASVTPALVMGRLFRNAQFHLAKAGGGVAENVRKDFEEISCALGDHFKPTLTLEEQGRFALGYYHQKAEYRRRSAERKEAEAKTEPTVTV
jgi:CRISPR-associated protein Csd1